MQQTHKLFALLLRDPPLSTSEVVALISDVLRRTEEARIYAWYQKTGQYPPSRKFILEEKELQ